MNAFEMLLSREIHWQKNFLIGAVWLPKSVVWKYWSYYHFYFHLPTNTFYVEDLDYQWKIKQQSIPEIIEPLAIQIFKKQLTVFNDTVRFILQNKIPSFIYFHNQGKWSNTIIKQNVELTPIFKNKKIVAFKNPKWKWFIRVLIPDDN